MSAALLAEATSGHGHVVRFFEEDATLVPAVAGFLGARLAARGAAIVVAGPERTRLIEQALQRRGVDVPAASASGRYFEIDAGDLLARFMREGHPDPGLFCAAILPHLREAGEDRRPIAIYGEMVSILWEAGLMPAAIELEDLWNQLRRTHPFSLFCGYNTSFDHDEVAAQRICLQHEVVLEAPPEEEVQEGEVRRWFEPTLYAAPAARRFATATMRRWGLAPLGPSVELAVSELATNSIVHAATRFLVHLKRTGEGVRVEVSDSGPLLPEFDGRMDPDSTGGRGVPLVAILAKRWGTDISQGAKTIWAEFDSASTAL